MRSGMGTWGERHSMEGSFRSSCRGLVALLVAGLVVFGTCIKLVLSCMIVLVIFSARTGSWGCGFCEGLKVNL